MVLASGGYPRSYETGKPIRGLSELAGVDDVVVFHAGTGRDAQGQLIATGGRVLNVTGLGGRLESDGSARLRVDGDRGTVVILDTEPAVEPDRVMEVAG